MKSNFTFSDTLFSNENFKNLLEQLPGDFIFKDLHSTFLFVTLQVAKWCGFKTSDQTIGLKDQDAKAPVSVYADIFVEQDTLARKNNFPLTTLDIYPYVNNEIKVLFSTRSKLLDADKRTVGTICHTKELNPIVLNKLIMLKAHSIKNKLLGNKNLNMHSLYLDHPYPNIKISKRQSQCLFHLLRGKSAKTIAMVLKLSPRTVEDYIDQIKNKMGCCSKAELIEKAIENGFLDILPEGVLNLQIGSIVCAD